MIVMFDHNDTELLKESNTMLLIIGRTASGKDTFANRYCKATGTTKVISYTTRPRRLGETDTHIFLDNKQALDMFKPEEKAAFTRINGHEYFSTIPQIMHNQVYVIDPNGLSQVLNRCPRTNFYVLYLMARECDRCWHFIDRNSEDPTLGQILFQERDHSEKMMFDAFEHQVLDSDERRIRFINSYPNLKDILVWRNAYIDGDLDMLIARIAGEILGDIRQGMYNI